MDGKLQGVRPRTPDKLWSTRPCQRCEAPAQPPDHEGWSAYYQVLYVVEFNQIVTQVWGYGEGALQHHFYNGLPDCIKDEISCIGKPPTLSELHLLAQSIDACYWECKSEINRQAKPSAAPPSKSEKTSATSSMNSGGSIVLVF